MNNLNTALGQFVLDLSRVLSGCYISFHYEKEKHWLGIAIEFDARNYVFAITDQQMATFLDAEKELKEKAEHIIQIFKSIKKDRLLR